MKWLGPPPYADRFLAHETKTVAMFPSFLRNKGVASPLIHRKDQPPEVFLPHLA
jgi:hypothetical protein